MTARDWAVVTLSVGLALSLVILCGTVAAHPILLASSSNAVLGTLLGLIVGVIVSEISRGNRT